MSAEYASIDFGDGDGGEANMLATFLTALYRVASRRDRFIQQAVHQMVQEAAADVARMELENG